MPQNLFPKVSILEGILISTLEPFPLPWNLLPVTVHRQASLVSLKFSSQLEKPKSQDARSGMVPSGALQRISYTHLPVKGISQLFS